MGILVLGLLIPLSMVRELVRERTRRQQEAGYEVRSSWAPAQRVSGPMLALPYAARAAGSGVAR